MDKREGAEYQDFPSKIFCLTVPKLFVEEHFYVVFQKTSGGEKFIGKKEGEYQVSTSEVFCLTVLKSYVQEPVCTVFEKISGSEKVY